MAHSEASEAATSTSLMWGRQIGERKGQRKSARKLQENGRGKGGERVAVGGRFKASRKNIFY